MSKPTFDQINIISGDLDASIAFYRRLGVEIPDAAVWRTTTGGHHVGVAGQSADQAFHFDIDSTVFAQTWNSGWKGRTDLRGRVIVGFSLATRADVDDVFRDMTVLDIAASRNRTTQSGARVMRSLKILMELLWA